MALKQLVLDGNFSEGVRLLAELNDAEVRDTLFEIGFDEGSILPYSFVCFCLSQKETARTHYLASELLSTAFCHLPGAYTSALFHTRRAIELSPDDVSLKEHLLLFHDIPEKLITTDEARKIAEEIILVAPDSPTAKSILGT